MGLVCAKGLRLHIREEASAYPAWKKLGEVYCPGEFTTEYTTLQEPFDTNQEDSILSFWFFDSDTQW